MKTVYSVEDFGGGKKFITFVYRCFRIVPSSINYLTYYSYPDHESGEIELEYEVNGVAAEQINDIVKEVLNA